MLFHAIPWFTAAKTVKLSEIVVPKITFCHIHSCTLILWKKHRIILKILLIDLAVHECIMQNEPNRKYETVWDLLTLHKHHIYSLASQTYFLQLVLVYKFPFLIFYMDFMQFLFIRWTNKHIWYYLTLHKHLQCN